MTSRALVCLLLLAAAAVACRHGEPVNPSPPITSPRVDAPVLVQPPALPDDHLASYTLSPKLQGNDVVALQVEMRFRGEADGTTFFELPERWAGARELWKNVYELKIEGATSDEIADAKAPWKHTLHAPPGAALVVRYEVHSAWDGPPPASVGQPFAPIIVPDWFYAFGQALFARLDWPEGAAPPPVRFRWEAPASFPFASDLQHLDGGEGNLRDLLDSIVIGGSSVDVRTAAGIGNEGLRVALAGKYMFAHEAFIELTQAILITERDFFGAAKPRFLVAMSPLVPTGGTSIGGTSVGDGFALSISQSTPLAALPETIAHEYFHSWNPPQLGGDSEAVEMRDKWFSEGFTNFYAARLLQRSGRAEPEDFAASWNKVLLAYATSPASMAPNQKIMEGYWSDPEMSKQPYHRGQMLAALWDQRLRQSSSGAKDLDDVILAMYAKVQVARAHGLEENDPPAELLRTTYVEQGGRGLDDDLGRYMLVGERLELPEDVFGGCAKVKTRKQAEFARGWDAEATEKAGGVVIGLDPRSPAYRAGLRDGMKLLAREAGQPGDSTVRYVMRVLDGGKVREISFWPRGKGTVTLQRVELAPMKTATAREACRKSLGGE